MDGCCELMSKTKSMCCVLANLDYTGEFCFFFSVVMGSSLLCPCCVVLMCLWLMKKKKKDGRVQTPRANVFLLEVWPPKLRKRTECSSHADDNKRQCARAGLFPHCTSPLVHLFIPPHSSTQHVCSLRLGPSLCSCLPGIPLLHYRRYFSSHCALPFSSLPVARGFFFSRDSRR